MGRASPLCAQADPWPWLYCSPLAQMLTWAWGHFPDITAASASPGTPRGRGTLWGGCKPCSAGSPCSERNGPCSSGNSSSEAPSSSPESQRSSTGCLSRSRSSGRAPVTCSLQGRKQRLRWRAPLGVEPGRSHTQQQHPHWVGWWLMSRKSPQSYGLAPGVELREMKGKRGLT